MSTLHAWDLPRCQPNLAIPRPYRRMYIQRSHPTFSSTLQRNPMLASILLAALQQQASPSTPAASPVARVNIVPEEVALEVGDTVRLRASAEDSLGQPVKNVGVRWFQSGGHFEGRIDSTGLVTGGSTGTLTVSALVSTPAGGSPATGFARVTVLPRPATKLTFHPEVARLYAGQSVTVEAIPYSADNDRRYDRVLWASDQPSLISVDQSGELRARRPGKATLTAKAGRASRSFSVMVVANPITSVQIKPETTSVRTGDVVLFTFRARGRGGR